MGHYIEHDGRRFEALGICPKTGRPIWPIGELLARIKISRRMAKRLRREYPNGKVEGSYNRGTSGRNIYERAVREAASRTAA